MAAQQNLKHLAPHRSEPLRARGALRFGMGNGSAGAALMVVIGRGENRGWHDGLVPGPARRRRCAYALIRAGPFCTSQIDRRSREKAFPARRAFLILHRSKKRPTFFGKHRLQSKGAHSAPNSSEIRMLQGKSGLVTGSTSGIGLAIARALAAQGANVTINGFGDKDAIEKERVAIEKDYKVKAIYSSADMTKAGDIAEMVRASEKTFGSLDVLVNNAGIQFVSPIEEFPIEKWNQIIAINLASAFHTIRAAVPGMKSRKWGRIINTASAHSLVASPFKVAYVSAKHGLAGLTKTVALEVATFGITCNCISPGYVWTPLVEKQIPDTAKARGLTEEQVKRDVLLAAQPTKEFVTVDEVADLAVYLCSDAAKSITGANLSIDGGWTAE
jgi:3-hydroxybutyrate dehydrogenase